jgi:hypothetical protein
LCDEDWIENDINPVDSQQPFLENTAAQWIREWRPQVTVDTLTTTQIGFSTTSITRTTNINGLGNLNQNNVPVGMALTGFISSREALSILPPEKAASDTHSRKRKGETAMLTAAPKQKPVEPKQTTLKPWTNSNGTTPSVEPAPTQIKPRSSGIIHDRGKAVKSDKALPSLQQMSSPDRGCDFDALPSLSFSSSPNKPPAVEHRHLDEISTSPLAIHTSNVIENSVTRTIPLIKGISSGRKSLGIRRGMKPWPSKKEF